MINEDSSLYIAPNYHAAFMIPREQMPQIASKDVSGFLKTHGVSPDQESVRTDSLKPTQSQFNAEKIVAMGERAKSLPILVSDDDFVLDGHHRWLANHFTGNGRQNVIRLPWDAKVSLSKMHDYHKTFTKAIHEDGAAAVSIGGGAIDNTVQPKRRKKTFLEWRDDTCGQ